MSLIQDKLGSEFLRPNGSMDGGFGTSMLMFSHLPPVTSFTRLAAQSVMADMPPQEMMSLKKERDSPDCGGGMGIGGLGGLGGLMGGVGDYVHAMGIKQEKLPEHDYRLPLYPGGGGGGGHNGVMGQRNGSDLLEVSLGNHQNLMVHDLSLSNVRMKVWSRGWKRGSAYRVLYWPQMCQHLKSCDYRLIGDIAHLQ